MPWRRIPVYTEVSQPSPQLRIWCKEKQPLCVWSRFHHGWTGRCLKYWGCLPSICTLSTFASSVVYFSVTACPFLPLAGNRWGSPARDGAGSWPPLEKISLYIFLLCYHAIFAAKPTFVFLPLKNTAPKYFLPLSKCSPEWSVFLFIKLHGPENGSREGHLLNAGFSASGSWSYFPHCFAGRFSKWKHQLFLKREERWDCLLASHSTDTDARQ